MRIKIHLITTHHEKSQNISSHIILGINHSKPAGTVVVTANGKVDLMSRKAISPRRGDRFPVQRFPSPMNYRTIQMQNKYLVLGMIISQHTKTSYPMYVYHESLQH